MTQEAEFLLQDLWEEIQVEESEREKQEWIDRIRSTLKHQLITLTTLPEVIQQVMETVKLSKSQLSNLCGIQLFHLHQWFLSPLEYPKCNQRLFQWLQSL
jgi:hypothetical protein